MIFNLITKKEYSNINPLIKWYSVYTKELAAAPKKNFRMVDDDFYLVDTFELAIELGFDANYLNDELGVNIWWTDSIDDTIASIIKEKANRRLEKQIHLSKKYVKDVGIQYENDEVITILTPTQDMSPVNLHIICKNVGKYFEEDLSFEKTTTYENEYRIYLKEMGLVEKEYSLESLVSYLKKLFDKEYYLYVSYIFYLLNLRAPGNSGRNAWEKIFSMEDYFNNVKIYGLDQSTKYDFNFKLDEDKRYFVQYEYNASDSVTGRMFPKNLNKYQALQTIPKDDRKLLKAEPGCVLLEFDFKHFELCILEGLYHGFMSPKGGNYDPTWTISKQPHEQTCIDLGLNPIKDRQIGKIINYSIIYGMTPHTIAYTIHETFPHLDRAFLKTKIEESQLYLIANLVEGAIKDTVKELLGKKFVESIGWRLIKVVKEHALLNSVIQSSAVDIFMHKMTKILEIFETFGCDKKNKLLIQNHDSVLIQLEAKIITDTQIIETIQSELDTSYSFGTGIVKLSSQGAFGTTWGELQYLNNE
jgi:hypothetical protein